MKVQYVVNNFLGVFESIKLPINQEDLEKAIEDGSGLFDKPFNMVTKNGHLYFPVDIMKNSILTIKVYK